MIKPKIVALLALVFIAACHLSPYDKARVSIAGAAQVLTQAEKALDAEDERRIDALKEQYLKDQDREKALKGLQEWQKTYKALDIAAVALKIALIAAKDTIGLVEAGKQGQGVLAGALAALEKAVSDLISMLKNAGVKL
jgi:hypothetical protein